MGPVMRFLEPTNSISTINVGYELEYCPKETFEYLQKDHTKLHALHKS